MITNKLIDLPNLTEYDELIKEYIKNHISDTILYNTCEYWKSQTTFIPADKQIIVYTDAEADIVTTNYSGDEVLVDDDSTSVIDTTLSAPMMKIGDGKTKLSELPFVNEVTLRVLNGHRLNTTMHTTQEEKAKWNTAVTMDVEGDCLIVKFVD